MTIEHEQLELSLGGYDLARHPEPLITIPEACRLFNVKAHILRRAIKRGEIKSYRLGNGRVRLRASNIEAVITASASGAVARGRGGSDSSGTRFGADRSILQIGE